MVRLRHLSDQKIWDTQGNTPWPFQALNDYIAFRTDVTGKGYFKFGVDPLASDCLMTIDNPLNADYCIISFAGHTDDASTPGTSSYWFDPRPQPFVWVWGKSLKGSNNALDPLFEEIPISQIPNIVRGKYDAWESDSLCMISNVHVTPVPYFGYGTNGWALTTYGWPFEIEGLQAVMPDDLTKWYMTFPIGKLFNGDLYISGYRKIYIAMAGMGPSIFLFDPDRTTLSLNAKIYAHLYEVKNDDQ